MLVVRYGHPNQRHLQAHPNPDRRIPEDDFRQQGGGAAPVVRHRAHQRRRQRVQRLEPQQNGQPGAGEAMGRCAEGDGLEVGDLCQRVRTRAIHDPVFRGTC